jgi:hypothetical protein
MSFRCCEFITARAIGLKVCSGPNSIGPIVPCESFATSQIHEPAKYTEQETRQRFEQLVKATLNTQPKPLKSMVKGRPSQSKKRRKTK